MRPRCGHARRITTIAARGGRNGPPRGWRRPMPARAGTRSAGRLRRGNDLPSRGAGRIHPRRRRRSPGPMVRGRAATPCRPPAGIVGAARRARSEETQRRTRAPSSRHLSTVRKGEISAAEAGGKVPDGSKGDMALGLARQPASFTAPHGNCAARARQRPRPHPARTRQRSGSRPAAAPQRPAALRLIVPSMCLPAPGRVAAAAGSYSHEPPSDSGAAAPRSFEM